MLFRRKRPTLPPTPRANQTAIAVMEHDLLGIKPEPGTAAALAIGLRRTGTCLQHQPIDTTAINDPRHNGLCTRCGQHMIRDDHGNWRLA